jgi:hypothetical protein
LSFILLTTLFGFLPFDFLLPFFFFRLFSEADFTGFAPLGGGHIGIIALSGYRSAQGCPHDGEY